MEESQQTSSVAPSLISCQALEQFLLLTKTARGPAVIELIKQALDAPGVYVFGELLGSDCVREIASDSEGVKYVRLLELFAYGTYSDYKCELVDGHLCQLSFTLSPAYSECSLSSSSQSSTDHQNKTPHHYIISF